MKTETIKIGDLSCLCCANAGSGKIACVLYPLNVLGQWIAKASADYGTSIVVITGMDWDNDLTPWPAPGVPKGDPDFKGLAPEFLKRLTTDVLPQLEKHMGLNGDLERTLVGVSLSGLFTLWQWPLCDYFRNIGTMSGSYWYEGFAQWLCKQNFSSKTGKCYMLLGKEEPKAADPTFRTVGVCTNEIVAYLREQGADVTFDIVPGNHFQYGIERLNKTFANLFKHP